MGVRSYEQSILTLRHNAPSFFDQWVFEQSDRYREYQTARQSSLQEAEDKAKERRRHRVEERRRHHLARCDASLQRAANRRQKLSSFMDLPLEKQFEVIASDCGIPYIIGPKL